ncbi:MAG: hydrolase [Lachnospiraceae bacterium]|nr:hydrolase [Lachnospiraceae bacterium]
MIYYTGDLHLGHANVIRHDQRPFATWEEMDQVLIENWNNRVTDTDLVYIGGDLIYKSERPAEWYLEQLKGIKFLIVGNHEQAILDSKRARSYFEAIDKMMHITDGKNQICMCHFPIAEWNGYYRKHYHIYGHIHKDRGRTFQFMCQESRALNAGCMINGYRPVTFKELMENNQLFQKEAMKAGEGEHV